MRRNKIDRSGEVLAGLRALFAAAPWTALGLMFLLTPDQWDALVSGDVLLPLRRKVSRRCRRALVPFGLDAGRYGDDLAHEVLLKLRQGRFLKRYDPRQTYPKPYLMAAAFQYARTQSRSFWRKDRRTRPLPEE